MKTRRRFKQTQSLEERLADEAMRLRAQADLLPPGPVREAALKKSATGRHGLADERMALLTRPDSATLNCRQERHCDRGSN
ncbi:hypothetical protein [Bradyrhizobium sp. CCBAU 53421]|uniref:hypothetical protein n=1 Tax=Bradyrhizobium sp. CCBAU 53421 TaxID=1325120 RepID=UPI00353017EE